MGIVCGIHQVSVYADSDGNYRAVNFEHHMGFVGYGPTPKEASENLSKNIHAGKRANPLAWMQAMHMNLSHEDRVRFDEHVAKVGSQKVQAA